MVYLVSQRDIYNIISKNGGRATRKHIEVECIKLDPDCITLKSRITTKIASLVRWQILKRDKWKGGNGTGKSDMTYSIIADYDNPTNRVTVEARN